MLHKLSCRSQVFVYSVFGWPAAEIIGESIQKSILPTVDSKLLFAKSVANNNVLPEVVARNRNGEAFPLELSVAPISRDNDTAYVAICRDISERKAYERDLRQAKERAEEAEGLLAERVKELEDALSHVEVLRGIIPICMHCHRVRHEMSTDDQSEEFWERIDTYIENQTGAQISHALCDDCMQKYYSDALSPPDGETP